MLLRSLYSKPFKGNFQQENVFDDFAGVDRRQQQLFSNERLTVIEDYAHHPREIAVILQSIELFPDSTLAGLPTPSFSRTEALCKDFIRVLAQVEHLYLLPLIPPSRRVQGEVWWT